MQTFDFLVWEQMLVSFGAEVSMHLLNDCHGLGAAYRLLRTCGYLVSELRLHREEAFTENTVSS